jgi:hypothetical protein
MVVEPVAEGDWSVLASPFGGRPPVWWLLLDRAPRLKFVRAVVPRDLNGHFELVVDQMKDRLIECFSGLGNLVPRRSA